jgi:DNA primase
LEKSTDQLHHKKQYALLCTTIAQWCHDQLSSTPVLLSYLEERRITKKSIEHFLLGFLPFTAHSLKALLDHCNKAGFLQIDLLNAHFFAESKTLYSPFENRLIIPIKDHLGNICGFGGRTYQPHDERPKYYNSHDHEFFNKGTILFGLDSAKKEIQSTHAVFLVEGYFDCIAMHQAGYINTVATLGTACTLEHLKLVGRYAEKILVTYDGDKAGHNAILRLAQLCWQVDLELSVISLPAQEDPASYLATHRSLQTLYDQQEDIFLFCLRRMGTDFQQKNLQERLHRIRYFLTLLIPLRQPLKQDLLLQKASQVFEIPFDSLKNEFLLLSNPEKSRVRISSSRSVDPEIVEDKKSSILEKKIFFTILKSKEWPNDEDLDFLAYNFSPPLNTLLKKLISFKKATHNFEWVNFFDTLHETEKNLMSKFLIEIEEFSPDSFDTLFVHFFKKQWKMAVNDVKLKLMKAEEIGSDTQVIKKILDDFQNLKQKLLRKGLL